MSREAHVQFCESVEGRFLCATHLAVFHDDPAVLEAWRDRIAEFLCGRRLLLHPRKTVMQPTRIAATFLGFDLCGPGWRRLPEDNIRRFRNRLRGLRDRWRSGTVDGAEVQQRVQAWVAHAQHANTWRLRRAILGGGWFDPGEMDRIGAARA